MQPTAEQTKRNLRPAVDRPLLRLWHRLASASLLAALALTCGGCRIDTHKGAEGKDNVSIQTPLGALNVKTDTPAVLARIGLPAYPGAVADKKKTGKDSDSSSADVDMSFGGFHLRVLAAGFTTGDCPERVHDYYRKALAQYGDVIECRGQQPIGDRKRTGQGLTCSDEKYVHTDTDGGHTDQGNSARDTELKAGSPSRQHIVSFSGKDGGTHFWPGLAGTAARPHRLDVPSFALRPSASRRVCDLRRPLTTHAPSHTGKALSAVTCRPHLLPAVCRRHAAAIALARNA